MITRTVLVTVALAAGTMTACSSSGGNAVSSSGNYCGDLKATATYFKALGSGPGSAVDYQKLQSSFHALAGEAPSGLKADWTQLNSAIDGLLNALSKAGLKPSDLASAASLPKDKLAKLEQASKSLEQDSAKTTAASDRIEKDAKDRCHVDLSSK